LEESLAKLKENVPVQIKYETTFLVTWPEHLGGGESNIDLEGTMMLVPLLPM
jgi:hypothetical protein